MSSTTKPQHCRACGGLLIQVGERDGRTVFNCEKCNDNELLGCTVCGKPRGIWADSGTICGMCALDAMDSKRTLTPAQHAKVSKWAIPIRLFGKKNTT